MRLRFDERARASVKFFRGGCLVAVGLVASSVRAIAGGDAAANQLLFMEVKGVTRLVVSGNPLPLVIARATGALSPVSVSDGSTRYSLVTNLDNVKISASIDRQMPHGTSLSVRLESLRGTSCGEVDLSQATSPRVLVSRIGRGKDAGNRIFYTFSASREIRELEAQSRTITLTLTD
ncbi:MAG TPA: hypothetical protein VL126_03580 [Bacteroidota bacterium]|nr:hypothetical protein [Bacteroidota bacterium]